MATRLRCAPFICNAILSIQKQETDRARLGTPPVGQAPSGRAVNRMFAFHHPGRFPLSEWRVICPLLVNRWATTRAVTFLGEWMRKFFRRNTALMLLFEPPRAPVHQ